MRSQIMPTVLRGTVVILVALLLSTGAAGATTYDVLGSFTDGAELTGIIDVNNGELDTVNLNGNNALPGDNAVRFSGTPICLQSSCAPSQSYYSYLLGPQIVSEEYAAATQTYQFAFNGEGSTAYLNLNFTLQQNVSSGSNAGIIVSGEIYDPACAPDCPFNPYSENVTGGSLTLATPLPATPLPSSALLFLGGLGVLVLF